MAKNVKTQYANLTGKAKWAKVYTPDEAFGASKYKIDLYMDEKELSKFKSLNLQKKIKESEEGKYVTFDRADVKFFQKSGKVATFLPPIIFDTDMTPIVEYVNKETGQRVTSYDDPKLKDLVVRKGEPVLIGNGSEVTVNIAVYDTIKGRGQRLESIIIRDLITYEAPEVTESPAEEAPSDTKAPW